MCRILTYAYVLQAEKLAPSREEVVRMLAGCGRDLIVIDACYSGGEGGRWQPEEIAAIRAGKEGRLVLCYLSVGEAENYRPYWQSDWRPGTPAFLLPENPDWPGNFKVKFWEPEWQQLILSELRNIVGQDFDGVLLDIVDGFEFFENEKGETIDYRQNPETKNTYRQDMMVWVGRLATAARTGVYPAAAGTQPAPPAKPGFCVVPQNASQLLEDSGYAGIISGQALEDLYNIGNKRQSQEHVNYVMHFLRPFMNSGKPVMLTEYATEKGQKEYVRRMARAAGLRLLLTTRELDALGEQ